MIERVRKMICKLGSLHRKTDRNESRLIFKSSNKG